MFYNSLFMLFPTLLLITYTGDTDRVSAIDSRQIISLYDFYLLELLLRQHARNHLRHDCEGLVAESCFYSLICSVVISREILPNIVQFQSDKCKGNI